MRTPFRSLAVLAATMLVAGVSHAQAPNLDAIPDAMPFDVPYGAPVSLEWADALINAGVAEAKKRNWKMNITVVDSGGNLVAFKRMDGAQLASISISEHKARAAVTFRRKTRAFEDGIQKAGLNYIITLDGAIGSRGGVPLVSGGRMVGAIGCSGGTGSQDEAICEAAAATFK